ncbi:MAG: hypothetical protein IJP10_03840 [Clostridia bacterium]|nr:hypothetical protein [Oscillospiraceae bacterium]MBQ6797127.1 hypothetical protein [Clostridia bacterium]
MRTEKFKKWLAVSLIAVIIVTFGCMMMTGCSCASIERSCKTCKSEMTGGLDRTVNVYSYDGTLIASYSGKIDIEENDTKVLFELDGKRYVYYNAIVEVIEN